MPKQQKPLDPTDPTTWPALNTPEYDALVQQWKDAETNANLWKQQEAALRRVIFGTAFPAPTWGTNKVKLNHGMALIGDHRINLKIDRAAMDQGRGFIKPEVFEEVVSFRPEIKDGAYKKLDPENKKLFATFVTETPGLPGIEIKPANKVRW